jgi:hypothetical protein
LDITYAFTSYNAETIFGYGSESEAILYLDVLNAGREINLFEMSISSLTDSESEDLACVLFDELGALDAQT